MDKEKYVDESWKEHASQEKEILIGESDQPSDNDQIITGGSSQDDSEVPVDQNPPVSEASDAEKTQSIEVNFLNYITSLGFQAMIFMGEIPNPVTNEVDKNLDQAKFLVDTLSMLKEKTAGNLNDQEKDLLENSVYELQLRYVQALEGGSSEEGEKA